MNPQLEHKRFVSALITVLSSAVSANLFDDARSLLSAIRVLRPRMPQLDGLEANIAAQQGRWHDALRLLDNLEREAPDWQAGRSLRVYCLWACGNPGWQASAEDLLSASSDADTADFMKRLLAIASGISPAEPAVAAVAAVEAPPMMNFLAV